MIRHVVSLAALLLARAAAAGEIDHLMTCQTEVACQTDPVVGRYWIPPSADGPGSWRGDVTIPGVEVYTSNSDGSRTDFSGWFIVVALPELDPALRDDGTACVLIADRNKANAGDPSYLAYTAPNLTPDILSAARVEPTFAGSNYPFGAP